MFRSLMGLPGTAGGRRWTSRLVNPLTGATATHTPNAEIEWTFTYKGGDSYVGFRMQDAANGLVLRAFTDGGLYFYSFINNVYAALGWEAGCFANDQTYRVKVVMVGNAYEIFVDGVSKILCTDADELFLAETTLRMIDPGTNLFSEVICWPLGAEDALYEHMTEGMV